jgi:hypothetical protein
MSGDITRPIDGELAEVSISAVVPEGSVMRMPQSLADFLQGRGER